MKAILRDVIQKDKVYPVLAFVCPGCTEDGGSGLHMLPVNTDKTSPAWTWNNDLIAPTITPSILTRYIKVGGANFVCHSYLKDGVFEFLGDCTHSLVNQKVPIPDLPDWVIKDVK